VIHWKGIGESRARTTIKQANDHDHDHGHGHGHDGLNF
jgi:hypothetical protein